MIQRSSLVVLFMIGVGAHADVPDQSNVTRTASQVQQYHEDRLRLQGGTKTVDQNQQYHLERLRLNGGNKTANQNQQYHQDRLRLNGGTKTANQTQEYHQRLLQLLQTTGGKTADARLKQYLKTYLAKVDAKGSGDHERQVVDFGGCLIQRLYWNEKVTDAKAACATAVPDVKIAHVERCFGSEAQTTSRECVTNLVNGELSAMAGAGGPVKTATSGEAAAAS